MQVALNGTLSDAEKIISQLPLSDRIIIEAGTPLIKHYGEIGIEKICQWYRDRLSSNFATNPKNFENIGFFEALRQIKNISNATANKTTASSILPYVVADLKTMDRGGTEVEMAARAGASAAVALGSAPIETLNAFIASCEALGLDAMIDMMNVEYPLAVLRALKKQPPVVILHRGVDEKQFNHEKQIPLHEIRRIKGNYDIMISIAGGDTIREVQRSIFNDADIVVIWKSVYQSSAETIDLIKEFLKEIK